MNIEDRGLGGGMLADTRAVADVTQVTIALPPALKTPTTLTISITKRLKGCTEIVGAVGISCHYLNGKPDRWFNRVLDRLL